MDFNRYHAIHRDFFSTQITESSTFHDIGNARYYKKGGATKYYKVI
jgi:hypothetical protein